MNNKPIAIENYETERDSMDQFSSISFEHPIERLKHHIHQTKGKMLKSECSFDGTAYVIWESQGKQYRAWCTWPDNDTTINWKAVP